MKNAMSTLESDFVPGAGGGLSRSKYKMWSDYTDNIHVLNAVYLFISLD